MRKPYPTDLSDAEWECIEPHLPTPRAAGLEAERRLTDLLEQFPYIRSCSPLFGKAPSQTKVLALLLAGSSPCSTEPYGHSYETQSSAVSTPAPFKPYVPASTVAVAAPAPKWASRVGATSVILRGAAKPSALSGNPAASTKTFESLACREPWSLPAWNVPEISPKV